MCGTPDSKSVWVSAACSLLTIGYFLSAGIICASTSLAGVCGSNGSVSPPSTSVGGPELSEARL